MDPVSLIVADSEYLVRAGLRHLLEDFEQYDIVAEVTNENDLMHQVATHEPKVVILDYNQPRFSLETINKLKTSHPDIQVLIISNDQEKSTIYQALEREVNSYLTKECGQDEIIGAIQATAKGEKFFCSNVLNYILEKSFGKEENCEPIPLSPREIEIVGMVAKGMISKEIAAELNLSTHTIYTHRKNIMKKLGLSSTSELVLYALDKGIIRQKK
jgi:DNA-binding NarL/FixJ family response regulator